MRPPISVAGRNPVSGNYGFGAGMGEALGSIPGLVPVASGIESAGEFAEPLTDPMEQATRATIEAYQLFAADHPYAAAAGEGAGLGAYGGPWGMLVGSAAGIGIEAFTGWMEENQDEFQGTQAGVALAGVGAVVGIVYALRRPKAGVKLFADSVKNPKLAQLLAKLSGSSVDDVVKAGSSFGGRGKAARALAKKLGSADDVVRLSQTLSAGDGIIAAQAIKTSKTALAGSAFNAALFASFIPEGMGDETLGAIGPGVDALIADQQINAEPSMAEATPDQLGLPDSVQAMAGTPGVSSLASAGAPQEGREDTESMSTASIRDTQMQIDNLNNLTGQLGKSYAEFQNPGNDEMARLMLGAGMSQFMAPPGEDQIKTMQDVMIKHGVWKILVDNKLSGLAADRKSGNAMMDQLFSAAPQLFGDQNTLVPPGTDMPDDDLVARAAALRSGLNWNPQAVAGLQAESDKQNVGME
jgi:hypothetical protein